MPGAVDAQWLDWNGIVVTVEAADESLPVTVLTTTVDQAALHGLLRRLYSLGLPLISVICIACDPSIEK